MHIDRNKASLFGEQPSSQRAYRNFLYESLYESRRVQKYEHRRSALWLAACWLRGPPGAEARRKRNGSATHSRRWRLEVAVGLWRGPSHILTKAEPEVRTERTGLERHCHREAASWMPWHACAWHYLACGD